jgi:hypothetical protein
MVAPGALRMGDASVPFQLSIVLGASAKCLPLVPQLRLYRLRESTAPAAIAMGETRSREPRAAQRARATVAQPRRHRRLRAPRDRTRASLQTIRELADEIRGDRRVSNPRSG